MIKHREDQLAPPHADFSGVTASLCDVDRACAHPTDFLYPQKVVDETTDFVDMHMEQCINLDLYLTPLTASNAPKQCTDELSTPTILFDADATKELNKIISNSIQDVGNPFDFPFVMGAAKGGRKQELDHTINEGKRAPSEGATTPIDSDNNHLQHFSNNNQALSSNEEGSLLTSNDYSLADLDGINLDEYDLLADYHDAILNDKLLSSASNSAAENVTLATPPVDHHNYALKLNFDACKFTFTEDDIQTPDIINTICSIESEYDLVGEIIKAEDLIKEEDNSEEAPVNFVQNDSLCTQNEESQPYCHDETSNSTTTTTSSSYVSKRSKRRRTTQQEDDDEDYIPPAVEKRKRPTRKSTFSEFTSDEEFIPSPVNNVAKPKRGRPSKPVAVKVSRSTADDVGAECSKYREMRDKNNEASRKSRRKRRELEMIHENECGELMQYNERLKVQVSELEKTVNTFRANLMQLLLKK